MCGIVGYTGGRPAAPILLDGLSRLEYRGYDSAGIAVIGDELDGAHVAILRGILEEGVATGEFDIDDVELAANYIFFLCAVWPLRHWSIGDHGVETVTENMSRFVLRAVGAEEMTAKTKVA